MGGRSLRFTAERIYGSSAVAIGGGRGGGDARIENELDRLDSLIRNSSSNQLWRSNNPLLQDVGGFMVWQRLLKKIKN